MPGFWRGKADATAAAGDEDDLVGEPVHL